MTRRLGCSASFVEGFGHMVVEYKTPIRSDAYVIHPQFTFHRFPTNERGWHAAGDRREKQIATVSLC